MKSPLVVLLFCAATAVAAATPTSNGTVGPGADWLAQVGAIRGLPIRVSPSSIVTSRIDPAYPMEMRAQGIPGYVKLEVAVDDHGNVVAATVLEANRREFADAAMHAISAWRFVAANESEMDCLRRIRVPIRFVLTMAN